MTEGVDDAAEAYVALLLAMHENRPEVGGQPDLFNQLVDEMQVVHLRLRESDAGRAAISQLCDHENATVRRWSATNALSWDARKARRALNDLVNEGGLAGFEAKVTLQEFKAGRLVTDWVPGQDLVTRTESKAKRIRRRVWRRLTDGRP